MNDRGSQLTCPPGGMNTSARGVRLAVLAALAVAVAAAVLAAHWPVLSAQATTFDDHMFLTDNPLVRNPGWASARRFLTEVLEPSTVKGYYIPLTMISLMLDYARGGRPDDLTAFHRTALALHVLNTVLVIVLIHLLFREPWIAAVAGLLYGVHPLTVEPVAWISERKTTLATFFALWSLTYYVYHARRGGRGAYAAAWIAYLLAVMSKPTALPLPILMLLVDWWPLRRLSVKAVVEKAPFFVLAAVSGVITLISHQRTAGIHFGRTGATTYGQALLLACYEIVFYSGKIVWPTRLSSYYPVPQPIELSHSPILIGVVGTIGLAAGLLASLRWSRGPLTGGLFALIALSPTLGLVGYSWVFASDKYLYLPAVGLLLALAVGLVRIWESSASTTVLSIRRVAMLVVVIALAAAAARSTHRQLAHWQTTGGYHRYMLSLNRDDPLLRFSYAIFLHEGGRVGQAINEYGEALRLRNDFPRAHHYLAKALALQGDAGRAIHHLEEAVRLQPDFAQAHLDLGEALASRAEWTRAAEHFRIVAELDPSSPKPHLVLGDMHLTRGKADDAIAEYQKVLDLGGDPAAAHVRLAEAFGHKGDMDQVIAHAGAALELDPGNASVHNNLGAGLAAKGRVEEAIPHYLTAIRLDPDHYEAYNNLGVALVQQGRLEDGIKHLRKAISMKGGYVQAHNSLGAALVMQGALDEAIEVFRSSLDLMPGQADIHFRLGDALARKGRLDEAVERFQATLRLNPSHPQAQSGLQSVLARRATATTQTQTAPE